MGFSFSSFAAGNRKLETGFLSTGVVVFIVMAALLAAVMAFLLLSITETVSRDYARLYSSRTIGILNTHLNREIGLVKKAVQSNDIVEWFIDEGNYAKRITAYQELKSFMSVLNSANLYFGVEASKSEYSMDRESTLTEFASFDLLSRERYDDKWYFACLDSRHDYVLNVDIDKLKGRKLVWLNYKVVDKDTVLGVFAAGLQFDRVIDQIFGAYDKKSVREVVIDGNGVIQMDSGASGIRDKLIFDSKRHIRDVIEDPAFTRAVDSHLAGISSYFAPAMLPTVVTLSTGKYSYAAIAPIESTDWTVVTFYNSSSLFSIARLWPLFLVIIAAFVVYSLSAGFMARKYLFSPLSRLVNSIAAIGADSAGPVCGADRDDELGTLARTVRDMKIRLDSYNSELVEAMERAEKANKAKSEFLANMSHEMRTPMNAIIGMTKIAKDSEDEQKMRYCLDKIDGASAHLLGVINDILDMSKIESGKFELHAAPFHFGKMLRRVVSVLGFRMAQKHLDFSLSVDPRVPKYLVGDEQRLAQVITNLLTNAEKFTPENGRVALVVAFLDGDPGRMKISVMDSGIGISSENQEKLFRSFEQADGGISRKFGGTGLGLVISKKIVDLMGGTINLTSVLGKGSSFFFDVPAIPGEEPDEAISPAPDAPAGAEGPSRLRSMYPGKRILLAEDVEVNREVLVALLEGSGIVFEFAENGLQAVELFLKSPCGFDMILMDVQMPEMSGYEATAKIRAMDVPEAANVPIIAMTANVFREDVDKGLEAGMDEHLGKPVDIEELHAVFRKYFT